MKVSKLVTYVMTGGLCVILLVFLVRIVPLLLLASRPIPTPQPPPTQLPANNALTAMPTVVSVISTPTIASGSISVASSQETTAEIPLCTFNTQATPPPATLPLNAYTFAEPRVVLTNTTAIRLLQWLPDGQRILIARASNNHMHIETLNVKTEDVQLYAETTQAIKGNPFWLSADQSVLFVESAMNSQDILRIVRNVNQPIDNLQTDFATLFFSVDADTRYLIRSIIASIDSTETLRTAYNARLSPQVESYISLMTNSGEEYQTSLFSDGSKIALYNAKGFYLVDAVGQTCKLEALTRDRKWVLTAKWSADGRYLALIIASEFQPNLLDLIIFDTFTGSQRIIDLAGGIVSGIDWHPSHNTLLVTAQNTPQDPMQNYYDSLYLVNANEGVAKRFLEDQQYIAIGYWGALWSPSGQVIAIACHRNDAPNPRIQEGRICLVKVEIQR